LEKTIIIKIIKFFIIAGIIIFAISSCFHTCYIHNYYEDNSENTRLSTDELRLYFDCYQQSEALSLGLTAISISNGSYDYRMTIYSDKEIEKNIEEILINSIIFELPKENILLLENFILNYYALKTELDEYRNMTDSEKHKWHEENKAEKTNEINIDTSLFNGDTPTLYIKNIPLGIKHFKAKTALTVKYKDGTIKNSYYEIEFKKKTDIGRFQWTV
jgi:hypothetical protein